MRKSVKIVMLLLLFSLLLSCEAQEEIPKELQFSFEYLTENLNATEIEKFKSDSTYVGTYHFSLGLYLRNNLLRHHKKSDELLNFFNAQGIRHLDDMSSIILTSYHRYLNKENIELQSQVDTHIAYWEPIIECENQLKQKAEKLYHDYKVGDSLQIKIPVDNYNGIDYGCPNVAWKFDETKDLIVKGTIVKKYIMHDGNRMFFDIKVHYKNHSIIEIFSRHVNIGDEFNFHLATAWKIDAIN